MTIHAELADGRTLEFPDGTDPAVVQRTVKKMIGGGAPAAPVKAKSKPEDPFVVDPGSFVTEVPRAAVQNLGAKVASGYAGMLGSVLPGPEGQGAKFQRATEEALSFSPKSSASRAILTAVGAPVEYLWNKPTGWLADKLGPHAPVTASVLKGAAEAAPFALGLRSFDFAPPPVVSLAKERGFGLTPSEAGAGVVGRTVEGLAGEEKISKGISGDNAAKAATAIATDIGIPEGTPLTRQSIANARQAAHAAYEEARGLGEVKVTDAYGKALDSIEAQYKNAAKSFPKELKDGIGKQVQELVDSVRVESFDASAAVDKVKQLRRDADVAYANRNAALGKAYKDAAKAIEEELFTKAETPVAGSDMAGAAQAPGLAERLRGARTRIAKTYEADKIFDGDGSINSQKLIAMEKKSPGKLTGASKDIAKLAEEAPRSFRRDTGGNVIYPTWADAILSAITGGGQVAAHGATMGATLPVAAALMARPATRALITSDPYQAFQASSAPAAIAQAAPTVSAIAEEAKKGADIPIKIKEAPKAEKSKKWRFKVIKDRDGNIQEVEAVQD